MPCIFNVMRVCVCVCACVRARSVMSVAVDYMILAHRSHDDIK